MKSSLAIVIVITALTRCSPVLNELVGGGKNVKVAYEGVPFTFTSVYNIIATPDQVVNSDNELTGSLEGSKGIFNLGINSHENVICYNITLFGFRGDYKSPANTATHIHEAPKGQAGPPRIAFPKPHGEGDRRTSVGCLKGPFKTGIENNGVDT